MTMSKIAIYDEQLIFAESLGAFLGKSGSYGAPKSFNEKEKLINYIKLEDPEIVIVRLSLNSYHEVCEFLRGIISISKISRIISIGKSFEIRVIRKFFEAGIFAYLDKNSNSEELLKSIDTVMKDKVYLCDVTKERMINYLSNTEEKKYLGEPLTNREMDVLKLLSDGLNSREISEKLFISVNTVETHKKNIMLKLDVKNSVGIVKYAFENNILQ